METGVWKSFTPKTGPLAPAAQAPAPAASTADRWDSPIQDRPKEAAPAAAAPVGASADRWDVPIQARSARVTCPPRIGVGSGLPVNQIVEKMGSVSAVCRNG
jgi:hypothetical protein